MSPVPLLVPALAGLAVTLLLAPAIRRILVRHGILDVPSHRSSHRQPVPRGGGIAVATGVVAAVALAGLLRAPGVAAIVLASAALGVLGLCDDLGGLRPAPRLVTQCAVAALAVPWLIPVGDSVLLTALVLATAGVWLVAFTNFYNFMDGINGISVAQGAVTGFAWLAVGWLADEAAFAAAGLFLAGAMLGFAPYNVLRARLFLGDVGSYFIGSWLAGTAIMGIAAGIPPEAVLAPLAIYVADATTAIARGVFLGEAVTAPHRRHVYQRLTIGGWSHVRTAGTVAVFAAVSALLGATSLLQHAALRVAADLILGAVVLAYLTGPRWLKPDATPPSAAVAQSP